MADNIQSGLSKALNRLFMDNNLSLSSFIMGINEHGFSNSNDFKVVSLVPLLRERGVDPLTDDEIIERFCKDVNIEKGKLPNSLRDWLLNGGDEEMET